MKQKIMACLCACALAVVCAVPVMAADGNSNKVGIVSSDPATGITVYRDSGGATVLSGLPVPSTASPEERTQQRKMLDSLNEAEAQSKAAASEAAGGNSNKVGIISSDSKTGITVYRDSGGATVLSGLPVPSTASPEEQARQQEMLDSLDQAETATNKIASSGNYVDYESNPIYIGTWQNTACYARHTLGSYNSSLGYLTSYGYATYYNTSGDTALPYRNGAANNGSGQGVVDVAKYSNFSIRDLGTDQGTTLEVTDWGPNQIVAPDRIADLDQTVFTNLHGNSSDGVFYCRTWVPITNYNP